MEKGEEGGVFAVRASCVAHIWLHALRYCTEDVCGVLLGAAEQYGEDEGEDEEAVVEVEHAVPLFHSALTVAALDVAFSILQHHLDAHSLRVVGLWYGNSAICDVAVPFAVRGLHSSLSRELARPLLLAYVDPATRGLKRVKTADWSVPEAKLDSLRYDGREVERLLKKALATDVQERVPDFEAHMENMEEDWLKTLEL